MTFGDEQPPECHFWHTSNTAGERAASERLVSHRVDRVRTQRKTRPPMASPIRCTSWSTRFGVGWLLVLGSWTTSARAEPAAGQLTTARELFDQGRALMAEHQYARACEKFQESQRLDPGGGTLLNLALCSELSGKTATAWVHFRDALRWARSDRRADRVKFAEQHLASLAPKLSRLRIVVAPEARVPGLVVSRDGVLLGGSAWGEPLAIDPGAHLVRATAPGKQTTDLQVSVPPGGNVVTVTLAPLREVMGPPDHSASRARPNPGKRQQILAGVVGGVGVAVIGVGGFFGWRAVHRRNDADELCPSTEHCDPRAFELQQDALSDARVATTFVVGGAVLAVAGGYLFLSAPPAGSHELSERSGVRIGFARSF